MRTMATIGLMISAAFVVTGCASTGPVRYKLLGYNRYLTTEMPKRMPGALKPVGIPAMCVADLTIMAADMALAPIVGIPFAFENMGPCPQETDLENVIAKILVAPLWMPLAYPPSCVAVLYQDREFYHAWYGRESTLFVNAHDYAIDYAVVKTKADLLEWAKRTFELTGVDETTDQTAVAWDVVEKLVRRRQSRIVILERHRPAMTDEVRAVWRGDGRTPGWRTILVDSMASERDVTVSFQPYVEP